jgi:hypothetical protein
MLRLRVTPAARWPSAARRLDGRAQRQPASDPLVPDGELEASAAAGHEVPASVEAVLRSPGRPLDAGTRAEMGRGYGHDFGRVRVHADADESARRVDALAYTVGQEVVFAAGPYAPGTAAGKRLLPVVC